jgi:CheY-like chemotaxis protein
LDGYPNLDIIAEAGDGEEAITLARLLKPDLVVMDVNMPRLDGIEATRRIREELPSTYVVGLSVNEAEHIVKSMRAAGRVSIPDQRKRGRSPVRDDRDGDTKDQFGMFDGRLDPLSDLLNITRVQLLFRWPTQRCHTLNFFEKTPRCGRSLRSEKRAANTAQRQVSKPGSTSGCGVLRQRPPCAKARRGIER